MGDNVPVLLGVYVPTSEVLGITVGCQYHLSMNGVSGAPGEILKMILKAMVIHCPKVGRQRLSFNP